MRATTEIERLRGISKEELKQLDQVEGLQVRPSTNAKNLDIIQIKSRF